LGRCRLDESGSEQGPVSGYFEHGSENVGSTKGGEFLN